MRLIDGVLFLFGLWLCIFLLTFTAVQALGEAAVSESESSSSSFVWIPNHVDPPELVTTRDGRFPSREERLKLYMSNWYIPPCPEYTDGLVRYQVNPNNSNASDTDFWPTVTATVASDYAGTNPNATTTLLLQSAVVPDTAFFVDSGTILDCLETEESAATQYADRIQFRKNMNMYCSDVASTVLTAVNHVDWETTDNASPPLPPPTVVQFGDLKHSHVFGAVNIPYLKKFRSATSALGLDAVVHQQPTCLSQPRRMLQTIHDTSYYQPIIWKFASRRHFGNLESIYREDVPWELKSDMAVFRGQLTGSRNDGFNKHLEPAVNCMKLRRCRLVYTHANSTLIHARLTSTRNRLPDSINGVQLVAPAVTVRRLLSFKGVIMLEGNDVASGLKWALLSQSVVLMPTPKHTSWAMEELLQPWVHYIPVNDNATDVEEKMQWVVDNDETARHIAMRGSLWMEDLVFHPDAAEDDRWIQEEIIRRYRKHFVRGP
jgi:hypothetical protein